MKDRIPQNPGRALITPEGGGAPYHAVIEMADNPTEPGTPLSKATLLKDATAARLGLSDAAVPDDALNALADTRTVSQGGTGLTTVTAGSFLTGNGTAALVENTPLATMAKLGGGYTSCATAAATAAKTATLSGFALLVGAVISVKFTYANTAVNPTLNVNSTGAKPIFNHLTGAAVTAGDIAAGGTHVFVYNGTQWVLVNAVVIAATGVTTGTGSAYTLVASWFALADGATVRMRLHADMESGATLNINGTGAKPLFTSQGKTTKGAKAGSWVTVIYSSVQDSFILQGEGGGAQGSYGNSPGQISSFETVFGITILQRRM